METREKFEALPEIAKILKYKEQSYFDKNTGEYVSLYSYKTGFLNGAWYAFQEQEKKLAICEKLRDSQFDKLMAIKELCMERRGDIHWQVDVFIREVGGLLDESKPQ